MTRRYGCILLLFLGLSLTDWVISQRLITADLASEANPLAAQVIMLPCRQTLLLGDSGMLGAPAMATCSWRHIPPLGTAPLQRHCSGTYNRRRYSLFPGGVTWIPSNFTT
jgi:hypothetical protein